MSQRLSLCMIVRDEAEHLQRCLESVQGLVSEIIVVDTGSRDETVAIARRFGAVVKEIPWPDDFAAARNEALNLATGDWVLSLDADEALAPDSGPTVGSLLNDNRYEGYYLTIHNLQGDKSAADQQVEIAVAFRLWRNRPLYRFVGSIHEQVLPVIMAANPKAQVVSSGINVIHFGYLAETVRAKGKKDRNVKMLKAELARHPENQFLQFCLGGEYYLRRRYQEARALFQVAITKTPLDASYRPPLVKFYAASLIELGRWREAVMLLKAEIPQYPDFTDLTFLVATAHQRLGEYDQAIESFQLCARMGPAPCPPYWPVDPELGSCKAHAALGAACEAAGRYAEAIAGYAQAAMLKREWPYPLMSLVKLMARRTDEAQMLRVLDAFFPGDSPKQAANVASLLAHASRFDLALQRLEPLARTGALERGGQFAYAFSLAKVGRYDEALAICADGWGGTSFEPQVEALSLYCRLLSGEKELGLPTDPQALQRSYAQLAAIAAEDPPEVVAKLRRSVPQAKLLPKALNQRRER